MTHDKNCTCEECEKHPENCECPECSKHDENCSCTECADKTGVKFEEKGKDLTVVLSGRFDAQKSAEHSEKLNETLDRFDNVTFDMEDVSYVSSAFLRIMLQMAKKAKALNKKFVLAKIQSMVKEVLEMSGMIKVFEIK